MNQEEKEQMEFVNNIYITKAKRYLNISLIILIINFVTYAIFTFLDSFDFGFYFELTAFVILIIAKIFIHKSFHEYAKIAIILALIPLGFLFIYDIVTTLIYIVDYLFANYYYYFIDFLFIALLGFIIKAYISLCKAEGDVKYKESVDWFYDKKA